MSRTAETLSRRVAVVSLLAAAGFFAWWGLAVLGHWPEGSLFFAGLVLTWTIAAVGVHRERAWGPGFAAGLSMLSVLVLLPDGLRPVVAAFLGSQVLLLTALTVRGFAADEPHSESWRHAGLAFSAGLAMPWLLVVGLLPGLSCVSALLALGGFGLAVAGIAAAFRGRTWGLAAILGALPLLLLVPAGGSACHATPHDPAGELAALGLAIALVPWIGPVVRRLRRA